MVVGMVLPDLPTGLVIGIVFGIVGISFWIGGLLVFDRLIGRIRAEGETVDEQP